jgi:hypothetical protein
MGNGAAGMEWLEMENISFSGKAAKGENSARDAHVKV